MRDRFWSSASKWRHYWPQAARFRRSRDRRWGRSGGERDDHRLARGRNGIPNWRGSCGGQVGTGRRQRRRKSRSGGRPQRARGGAGMNRRGAGIAVVIPYGGGDSPSLTRQLDALSSQVDAPDLEVIVAANNAKAFAELEALNRGSRSGTFSTVDATTSPGASHARNVGWRSAQGSVILFCDADDLVPSDWVSALAKSLEDADVVGSPLRYATTERGMKTPVSVVDVPVTKRPGVRFFPSCSIGFRRSALEELNGWDENMLACEDTDICFRAARRGLELRRADASPVTYVQRGGFRAVARQNIAYGRGDIRFFRKHNLRTNLLRNVFSAAILGARDALLAFDSRRQRALATRVGLVVGWLQESALRDV